MQQGPLRVGLIGYGVIGQDVVRLVAERAAGTITVTGALVRDPTRTRSPEIPIITELPALLAQHPDVIVEAAGHAGLREHGEQVLRAGIDLIIISVGAPAEPSVLHALLEAAQQGNARLMIASGAIGGLDALAAASLGTLTTVVHTMRKPPATLLPMEEATGVTSAREIFRGNAREAVQLFPAFLNVAAAVALAGLGFEQTEVRVLADPGVEHSHREVQAKGAFGTFRFEITNEPIGNVGRGARLVAMSIIHTLLVRNASFIIG
jgi:aspartate dehydrogenase